jgi:hypothetical protein
VSRILIRSGKDPFTPVPAESTFAQDTYNTNVGNFLFAHSVHRALMVDGTELVSNSTLSETSPATAHAVARVNSEFDAFVIPLANAFRPEFVGRLEHLTSLVRQLDIPVVVVGVGAQASVDLDQGALVDVAPAAKDFVSAVLDRSASIGVRGEFTRDFLVGLGFPDSSVDIIGCPSLFLHGPDFSIPEAGAPLTPSSRLAVNVTDGVPGFPALLERITSEYADVLYVGQDKDDLRLVLWGDTPSTPRDPRLPFHAEHRLYVEDRVRFPLDAWTWFDLLRDVDFTVGTRLHGNVAALLAGSPALLLAHDSRTLELAETHALPHLLMRDVDPASGAAELQERYDPEPFNQRFASTFDAYTAFLDRNGLEHIHQEGRSGAAFDARLAETSFPPPVRPVQHDPDGVMTRLRWLRDGQPFDSGKHLQAYRHPFPVPYPKERSDRHKRAQQIHALQRELEQTRKKLTRSRERLARHTARLDRQAGRISDLEQRLAQQEQGSFLRRAAARLRRWGS